MLLKTSHLGSSYIYSEIGLAVLDTVDTIELA